jgi:hypothetical protein
MGDAWFGLDASTQWRNAKWWGERLEVQGLIEAYDTFARSADTGAPKVVITPGDELAA